MMNDEISNIISEYIDNKYLISCKNKYEAIEVLNKLKQKGYKLSSYSQNIISGEDEYNSAYANVSLVGDLIMWSTTNPNGRRVMAYSNIVDSVYDDVDDDFEARFADLLS